MKSGKKFTSRKKMKNLIDIKTTARLLIKIHILTFLILFFSVFVSAQVGSTTGQIKGKISTVNGESVAGAQITITDTETTVSRKTVSADNGTYSLFSLSPKTYRLTVESKGFAAQVKTAQVKVGETSQNDFILEVGSPNEFVVITEKSGIELEKTQQSNTISEEYIRNLPIDRRDFLTFSLLAPGIVDSNALADNSDFRLAATPQSGISFYGSNGRGNNITVDGAEANDLLGGVRSTVSQEAVQEFQINRSNYNAEFGSSIGGVINIISKTGTNQLRGSLYGYFRDQNLDAADPFATALVGDTIIRVKPKSNRQQYGGTIGLPIQKSRLFLFSSYGGLRRRENSTVSSLTSLAIFQPTAAQQTIINNLAANSDPSPITCLNNQPQVSSAVCAGILQTTLTSKTPTQQLFRNNSGVFPFTTDSQDFSIRMDRISTINTSFLRYNFTKSSDDNQNTRALVGFSRSSNTDIIDHNLVGNWTHIFSSNWFNETSVQLNYRNFNVLPNDPNGPELNIPGFGFFNRDISLPSKAKERRIDFADNLTFITGSHHFKLGGSFYYRKGALDFQAFFTGRFGFSVLPGRLISPQLASVNINQLQSFDLGLPTTYQQGFGDSLVEGTLPFYTAYAQDTWNVRQNLTFNYGMRYELDDRLSPLITYKKNFAPRVGFAWKPYKSRSMVLRGGYGIFYAPINLQIDFAVKALGEMNGFRQIPQVLTTFNSSNPFAVNGPVNVFRTLVSQGVIGIPTTSRTITPIDLAQFGFTVSQTGTRNPFTALFRADSGYRNPNAQQASFSLDWKFGRESKASVSYIWSLTQHITRSRDINLLDRPIGPRGIRDWSAAAGCTGAAISTCFRDPTLFQEILYESAASANYNGLIFEMSNHFGSNVEISGNYTLSKAFDMVTDYNSDFRAFDQLNERAEYARSAFDQRHKLVLYALINGSPQNKWFRGITLTPVLRANSGRPFNLLAGSDVNGDRSSNGDRPIGAGRNTGLGPHYFTIDARLSQKFNLGNEYRKLELTMEVFNLLNTLNYSSVNNTVGADFAAPFNVNGSKDISPSMPLGFTSVFETRRIQLGLKFNF